MHEPKPKWVIFDVGQVLYDFHKFVDDLAVLLKIEEEILWEVVDNSPLNSFNGEVQIHDFWRGVLKSISLESEYEKVMKIWNHDLKYWVSDTKKLLGQLEKKGYRLALLTNNWGSQTEDLQKNLSPHANIEFIIESSVEKLSKPDKRLYEIMEERIDSSGNEIYFIDDRQENLDTAINMGWQTFLYEIEDDNGKTSNDLIRKQLL